LMSSSSRSITAGGGRGGGDAAVSGSAGGVGTVGVGCRVGEVEEEEAEVVWAGEERAIEGKDMMLRELSWSS
jgi:hypothetical protein